MRKNIYITDEDLELLNRLKFQHGKSFSKLYRLGLSMIPLKELSMEEVLAKLGKTPFDVCETHHGYYKGCWKNHING